MTVNSMKLEILGLKVWKSKTINIQWIWRNVQGPGNALILCLWRDSPQWVMASSFTRFLDHTQWRTTIDKTPLDELSARRRDFYLTTHNTHNSQTSVPFVGFEPTIPAGERPQTYVLDRAVTGTGTVWCTDYYCRVKDIQLNCCLWD